MYRVEQYLNTNVCKYVFICICVLINVFINNNILMYLKTLNGKRKYHYCLAKGTYASHTSADVHRTSIERVPTYYLIHYLPFSIIIVS